MQVLRGLLVFLALGVSILAQSTATIVGRVTDASGAVVNNAKVTAKNASTNLERSTVSSDTGDFEIPFLPISGAYSLTVASAGFQMQELKGIVLQVDQRARIDVSLKVGNISERVTVEDSAPILNTESGSIGQVISNKKIVDLPLNGRNFVQLAALLPSAIVGTSGTVGGSVVAVSGGRQLPQSSGGRLLDRGSRVRALVRVDADDDHAIPSSLEDR